jgi:hypothetical protein
LLLGIEVDVTFESQTCACRGERSLKAATRLLDPSQVVNRAEGENFPESPSRTARFRPGDLKRLQGRANKDEIQGVDTGIARSTIGLGKKKGTLRRQPQ